MMSDADGQLQIGPNAEAFVTLSEVQKCMRYNMIYMTLHPIYYIDNDIVLQRYYHGFIFNRQNYKNEKMWYDCQ